MDYRERIYPQYAVNFQDAPEHFDVARAERWGRAYRYYFRGWLPEDRTSRIVEVACGGGRMLHHLKSLGYTNVTGVDVSEQQVQLAAQACKDVNLGDAIAYLSGNPGCFDLIIAMDLIEHFDKNEVFRFLDAAVAALAAGGRLILQTPNLDSPFGGSQRYNDFTHEVGFNPNSLSRIMALVGLRDVTSREQCPVPLGYSLLSSFRYVGWRLIRSVIIAINLIETGSPGAGVVTRVFLASGIKPK
jgi:2-polyprenyl-3-methyl-5-hydroxy-6-metoxy-1,4-benzoquinol methylase